MKAATPEATITHKEFIVILQNVVKLIIEIITIVPKTIVKRPNRTKATTLLLLGDTDVPIETKLYPKANDKMKDVKKWSIENISGCLI